MWLIQVDVSKVVTLWWCGWFRWTSVRWWRCASCSRVSCLSQRTWISSPTHRSSIPSSAPRLSSATCGRLAATLLMHTGMRSTRLFVVSLKTTMMLRFRRCHYVCRYLRYLTLRGGWRDFFACLYYDIVESRCLLPWHQSVRNGYSRRDTNKIAREWTDGL